MTYQQEQQIIDRLKTISTVDFKMMVNSLLSQGAFPEIIHEDALIEQWGINMGKRCTIKSGPKADAESGSGDVKIEKSTAERWDHKLIAEINRHKATGERIRIFAFFTSRDTDNKQIKINGKSIDAKEYIKAELGCAQSWIIDQKNLVLPMQNPKYFNIRKNFLSIDNDYFCSAREYSNILETNPTLKSDIKQSTLKRYSIMLKDRLSFNPSSVVLLHNDDYITLLNAIGFWALDLMKEQSQNFDFCFIRWPEKNAHTASIDINEVSPKIQTFMIVWDAYITENLSEFLRFAAENVMIVFVTKTVFKETVRDRLELPQGNFRIEEVCVEDIDKRLAKPDEKAKHQEKIKTVVQELLDLVLRYEALVYFYSPFNLNDQHIIKKILVVLNIDNTKLDQLKELLIISDLAAITGRILWLKQPVVAKELLNDFISNDVISVSDLMTES